jgi:hypothetical protein
VVKKKRIFLSQRLACFFSKNRTLKPFFHFNCINGLCIGPDKYAVRFFVEPSGPVLIILVRINLERVQSTTRYPLDASRQFHDS